MKRSSEIIDRLTVKQITLESKNGSITLSADNNDGRVRFEPSNKVESGSFVVDLKNQSIAAENAFIKKINFYDGTYLDSAALINEAMGVANQGLKTIELKPNKIFFKYNGDDTPGAGQQIEIKVIKQSSLTGTPVLTITPDNVGIALNQTASDTYILTVAEFDKASADTIEIQATLINTQGTFTDILTIYKTRDGTDALVGGLSNPFLALQANSGGEVTDLATILSSKAVGIFTVFKGSDDLTNSGKVTYAVGNVTDNLTASINPTTGIYAVTNWSPDELVGEAIFTATDNITNQQIKGKFTIITSKQGETGVTGNGARTVKLIADDQQIAYKADEELLAPTSIQVTASQQNHVGTVYYEFIVYEGLSNIGTTLYNGTNDNILLTNTNKNYGNTTYKFIENTKTEYGKSKTLKVRTRENSPSAPIISSEDVITIIATRDGSDAFEIVFSNTNHSFPANSSGEVAPESYTGGGSIVEAYIGNEQLSPVLGAPASGQFTVTVSEQQNITSGLIEPDSNTAIKKMNIADPSSFISNKDSGSITYTITGKSSNGVSKTQLEKVSFTKSKQGQQGLPGSSGIDARAVELVSNIYQFNYNSSNTALPSGGFTLTASPKNTTGVVSYKFYKNNVLITTQSGTTLTRTDIPTANNSDSWKVELLEDSVVKAIDTVSIYGTRDGSDAITLVVPNDNHTFTADNSGGSINFAGSGTTIKLLVGSTPLAATTSSPPSSGQFNASLSDVSGITLGSITVTATDTLTLGPATAFGSDTGTATLSVNFKRPGSTTTETITRILTYSKSKQGINGTNGTNGVNARTVELTATTYQVPYNNANPSTTSVSSITLTATPRNTTGTVTYRFLIDEVQVQAASSTATFSADGANIPSALSAKTYKVELYENAILVAIDTISIVGTKDGSDAVTVSMPNNNHTFPAAADGTISSTSPNNYAGSGTTVRVFVGNTALTATNSAPTAGQFKVSASSISPANSITVPTPTVSSTTATIGNLSNFTADSATVTYTIDFRRPNSSTTETLTQIGTYSKSKVGVNGSNGINGADGIDLNRIWDFNQTFQYDSATLVPYGWNITPSSSTDLTAGNVADNILTPKFEPSGNYNYPYLSGSGYAGRFGTYSLPIGLTITSSQDSKYGGKLGRFCIQSYSSSVGTNQAYIYSAEPIPISVGNTYELAYRVKQNTNYVSTQIGLFFFDIEGNLITSVDADTSTISYAQTSFPCVKDTISSGFQSWTADRVVGYYSFETGGSLKTFPSNAKYVKPYIRIEFITGGTQGATAVRELLIDYLYFGEKITPNSRTGIWIDPITGRVTIGEANADIAGGSGGLQASKYDATANFEIISSGSGIGDVSDIKITRAHPYVYTSASYGSDVAIGRDFAAIRFAGWDGTFAGTSISSPGNMKIDERAEIRASYARTGSADQTAGALGGASLDFYTAPSRTTASFLATTPTLTASAPVLRARITDRGQFLVGYNDATTQIVNQAGSSLNPAIDVDVSYPGGGSPVITSKYLYDSNYYPILAVSGPIASSGFLVASSSKPSYINNRMMVKSLTPIIKSVNASGVITYTGSIGEPDAHWPTGYIDTLYGSLETGQVKIGAGIVMGTISRLGIGYANLNSTPAYPLDVNGSSRFDNGTLFVDSVSNRVGIGSTSPGSPLQVAGGTNDAAGGIRIMSQDTLSYWNLNVGNSSDDLFFSYLGVNEAHINHGGGTYQIDFTGQHRSQPEEGDISEYENKIGLIVVSSGKYKSFDNYNSISINEALPTIKLSKKRNEKNVFGVISEKEDINSPTRQYVIGKFVSFYQKTPDDTRLIINSLGEGGIWICNINGNFENGDYITTCEIPGYGMKQDDDLLHNYTVAKITCDCDFDLNSPIYICEEFEFESKTYRRAFVGCTYHCG